MSVNGTRSSLRSHDRKLHYRALLEDLSTLEDESDNQMRIQKTENAVREVQSLLADGGVEERVKHPGEGYLDSRVLRATSDLAVRCSESVSGNANLYDRHELAQHIKHNPSFWEFSFPSEVPTLSYLYGTFAPTPLEQRPRAPRRHVERQQAAALKAPESVDRIEKTEEGSEMVSRVHRFVKTACGRGPLSYFHCAIDPTSFSRSVENVYHLSFLVRDGLISVQLDEEHGLPFIKPVPAEERDETIPENQFIVSLDMKRWKDLVEAFDIRKPMMVLKRH
ncbi:EP300-interacting inhibitor of differentiation 3 [Aricia agestis]|uniref:EP300-interacting inhibitor of differentiation 3 n=1 Tax=Aricia agestis TaxID=91739 RepID=UPI001C205317|nr:EP300-interacting inhibitor of differentiation 3 [Aricia agestis]